MNITSLVAVWVFLLSPPEVGWTSYGGEATLPLTVAEPHLQRAIDEYVQCFGGFAHPAVVGRLGSTNQLPNLPDAFTA